MAVVRQRAVAAGRSFHQAWAMGFATWLHPMHRVLAPHAEMKACSDIEELTFSCAESAPAWQAKSKRHRDTTPCNAAVRVTPSTWLFDELKSQQQHDVGLSQQLSNQCAMGEGRLPEGKGLLLNPFLRMLKEDSGRLCHTRNFHSRASAAAAPALAEPETRGESLYDQQKALELTEFPPERIRNFSIIAHIDHGKSTLADRLLELTGSIRKGQGQPQFLDKLQVERERGITVKAQTASLLYNYRPPHPSLVASPGWHLLNLIDTPGHVDFSYEVSRSLAACQGALLVVDACQGVQAQTVANFWLAFEAGLNIIPVINKIDQPAADPARIAKQIESTFDIDCSDVLLCSAKTGQGLEHVLPAIIEKIRPPAGSLDSPLRMLLLDSHYDDYKGVICHVAVVDGALRRGQKIESAATGRVYEVGDVGLLRPEMVSTGRLFTGQVGYLIAGMKSTQETRVGDTLHAAAQRVEVLPGFKPARHMVFAGIYPAAADEFEALSSAIERLTLNDASVKVEKESSGALGAGFRCGFLGLLHMDVFHQRLEQEFGTQVVVTTPTVPYVFEFSDGTKLNLQNPALLPSAPKHKLTRAWEPTVTATIITPTEFVGSLMTLAADRRGEQKEYSFIDSQRALLKYRFPLREIVTDFYDQLKSITSGYASFDYEEAEYQESDLVKLDILLNGSPVDALASVVHRSKAQRVGRDAVEKLKKIIDRQMFEVAIQAAIGIKVVARESVSAMRKNVLAKCYGGDVSRKRKLLEKQKEGKKRMRRVGNVELPQEAFLGLLRS